LPCVAFAANRRLRQARINLQISGGGSPGATTPSPAASSGRNLSGVRTREAILPLRSIGWRGYQFQIRNGTKRPLTLPSPVGETVAEGWAKGDRKNPALEWSDMHSRNRTPALVIPSPGGEGRVRADVLNKHFSSGHAVWPNEEFARQTLAFFHAPPSIDLTNARPHPGPQFIPSPGLRPPSPIRWARDKRGKHSPRPGKIQR
jgi:hypothetical protein